MNGKINQTSLSDPTVPIGGVIRDTVGWEAQVPSGEAFNYRVYAMYGNDVDGTPGNFNMVFGVYIETGSIGGMSRIDDVDAQVPDISTGTYDCLTIVGYEETAGTITMFDFVIDIGVLTVELPLGASITSTSFAKV